MAMNTIKKIGKIRVTRIQWSNRKETDSKGKPKTIHLNYFTKGVWTDKYSRELHYTKYNIKETDFRIKTATFTSPNYIDLTEGQVAVLISSKYHENFTGIILDVDYEPSTGLYTYQCQDWSRRYMGKFALIPGNQNIYNVLIDLMTQLTIDSLYDTRPSTYHKNYKKIFSEELSGLRPLGMYNQSLYKGNRYKGNYFKQKPQMIIRNKTFIEAIRDLVYGSLGFYDVWFNDRGILQIEPLSKTDWEQTGLHLTTQNAMKSKYKFSTTNAITKVIVNGSGTTLGKSFTLEDLTNQELDLTAFFGNVGASISDPTSQNKNVSNATKTNAKSTNTANVNTDNPYGTKKKEVWITIDNIFGQSQDRKIMNDFASAVQKAGWTTHVGEVGPSYHYAHAPGYSWAGKVVNAVWFVIYGGACAGTLNEAATPGNWYRKPLADRGSRTVVGFIHPPCGDIRKGGEYYSWLPRAHDDNFSPSSFTGLKNPGQFLTNKGIPWMYAKDGKDLADKFLRGGDNPEACNKSWIP